MIHNLNIPGYTSIPDLDIYYETVYNLKPKLILHLGCGPGRTTHTLCKTVESYGHVIAVDNFKYNSTSTVNAHSYENLDYNKSPKENFLFWTRGLTNLTLLEVDANIIKNFNDYIEKMDFVLHEINDGYNKTFINNSLDNGYKCLRPGGTFMGASYLRDDTRKQIDNFILKNQLTIKINKNRRNFWSTVKLLK